MNPKHPGIIHKKMIPIIQDRVMFRIIKAGTTFTPKFIRGVVEVAFEEAERLGLITLIPQNKT